MIKSRDWINCSLIRPWINLIFFLFVLKLKVLLSEYCLVWLSLRLTNVYITSFLTCINHMCVVVNEVEKLSPHNHNKTFKFFFVLSSPSFIWMSFCQSLLVFCLQYCCCCVCWFFSKPHVYVNASIGKVLNFYLFSHFVFFSKANSKEKEKTNCVFIENA